MMFKAKTLRECYTEELGTLKEAFPPAGAKKKRRFPPADATAADMPPDPNADAPDTTDDPLCQAVIKKLVAAGMRPEVAARACDKKPKPPMAGRAQEGKGGDIHSAKAHRCVDKVQRTGKSESSAWAICTDSIGKGGVYAKGHGGSATPKRKVKETNPYVERLVAEENRCHGKAPGHPCEGGLGKSPAESLPQFTIDRDGMARRIGAPTGRIGKPDTNVQFTLDKDGMPRQVRARVAGGLQILGNSAAVRAAIDGLKKAGPSKRKATKPGDEEEITDQQGRASTYVMDARGILRRKKKS